MSGFDESMMLDALRAGLQNADPIPETVREAAKSVFTWRTIDAELLELGFDSAIDDLVGVRSGEATVRAVRFSAGTLEVEVSIDEGTVDGLLVGAESARVHIERTDGTSVTSAVDELGRFGFEDVAPGPIRLRIDTPGASRVTQWFVI